MDWCDEGGTKGAGCEEREGRDKGGCQLRRGVGQAMQRDGAEATNGREEGVRWAGEEDASEEDDEKEEKKSGKQGVDKAGGKKGKKGC